MPKSNSSQMIMVGLAAAASLSLVYFLLTRDQDEKAKAETKQKPTKALDNEGKKSKSISPGSTPPISNTSDDAARAEEKNKEISQPGNNMEEKALHAKIEEMDKKGKALFKDKQVRSLRYAPIEEEYLPFFGRDVHLSTLSLSHYFLISSRLFQSISFFDSFIIIVLGSSESLCRSLAVY
jgi:hypothetical protein